jgi:hypothetical protein
MRRGTSSLMRPSLRRRIAVSRSIPNVSRESSDIAVVIRSEGADQGREGDALQHKRYNDDARREKNDQIAPGKRGPVGKRGWKSERRSESFTIRPCVS